MFLLDTNIASEATKFAPLPAVMNWVAAQAPATLHLSVVSLAEIRYGIELRAEGQRRRALEAWYPGMVATFGDRILPIDRDIAELWGDLRRRTDLARRTIPIMDAFLAATAQVHGLTVVTRNVRNFEAWGGPVFDPWSLST
jgi:predicted nucleic acid-binding protein